ncbi:hypothetical protein K9L67_02570 [Candidatus Woesearchaeota archaeon]|nr:hypothetical protein [Candidatus Woesearchaeota archaeon]MCF7901089.1 hypothetical protein [Candidatus Woesearchaeota archaeon]MCF8013422.1 hypothetical protein [Candidatus Woesearchaeota archaeon]
MSEKLILSYYEGEDEEKIAKILQKAHFADNTFEAIKILKQFENSKNNLLLAKNIYDGSVEGAYFFNKLDFFGNVGAVRGKGHLAVKIENEGTGKFILNSLQDLFSIIVDRKKLKYIDHHVIPTDISSGFFNKNGYDSLPDYDNEGGIRPYSKRFFKSNKSFSNPMLHYIADYVLKIEK